MGANSSKTNVLGEFPIKQNYSKVPGDPLGQGSYGSVLLFKRKTGVSKQWPEFVAVKALSIDKGTEVMRQREMEILSKLQDEKHENVIKYFGSIVAESDVMASTTCLVMEACHADLRKLIGSGRELRVDEVRFLAKQLLEGLNCLHNFGALRDESVKFIHRDLKPENILMKVSTSLETNIDWKAHPIDDITLLIADFGLGRSMPANLEESGHTMTAAGTHGYMAPEVAQAVSSGSPSVRFNEQADVYSMGVIIYELAVGQKPSGNIDSSETWNSPTVSFLPIKPFLLGMLQWKAKERTSVKKLLQHPFLSSLTFPQTINIVHFNENLMFAGGRKGGLFAVDTESLIEKTEMLRQKRAHSNIKTIDSCGDVVAAGGQEGAISIWKWNPRSGWTCGKIIDCHGGEDVRCIRMNGKYLISMGDDLRLVIHRRGRNAPNRDDGASSLAHGMGNVNLDGNGGTRVMEEDDGCFDEIAHIQLKSYPDRHTMVMKDNQLVFVNDDSVRHFELRPDGDPRLVREMQIKGTLIISICEEKRNSVDSDGETGSLRHFWLGTYQGHILKVDLQAKTVLRDVAVWKKGHVRQVDLLGKYLICRIQHSTSPYYVSCLAYELRDLDRIDASAANSTSWPTESTPAANRAATATSSSGGESVRFGGITSNLAVVGGQHVVYSTKKRIEHFHETDIDRLPKTKDMKLHPKFSTAP